MFPDLTALERPGSRQGNDNNPDLRVSSLYSYPVKGCAPVTMAESQVTRAGLAHDRTFMVIGEDGDGYTQRRHPRLALIRPEVSADGSRLLLVYPGRDTFELEVDTERPRRDVRLFGVGYAGIDQGDGVAAWLSDALETSSRLVRVPPEHARVTDGQTPGTSAYADSCPIHLLSTAALHELNRRLVACGASPMAVNRFRPNIVVSGSDRPHIEDGMRCVRIGDAELGYAKLAIRCVVTTVDQVRGAKTGPEPLRTLAGYRRAAEGGVAFGVKFAVAETGHVAVGGAIDIVKWGPSEL